MLLIDVHGAKRVTSLAALRSRGVRGVYLKASEGATFTDPAFGYRRDAFRKFGIRVGAYHFAYPTGGDAPAEAEHFCRVLGELRPGELFPALDLEANPGRLSGPQLTAWARVFNRTVREKLGLYPIFYSYPAFIAAMHPDFPIGAGLWYAHPGINDGHRHPTVPPHPWKGMLLHQFTSKGRILGVEGDVDLNWCERIEPLIAPIVT